MLKDSYQIGQQNSGQNMISFNIESKTFASWLARLLNHRKNDSGYLLHYIHSNHE